MKYNQADFKNEGYTIKVQELQPKDFIKTSDDKLFWVEHIKSLADGNYKIISKFGLVLEDVPHDTLFSIMRIPVAEEE